MLGDEEWGKMWTSDEPENESDGDDDIKTQKDARSTLKADRLNTLRTLRKNAESLASGTTPIVKAINEDVVRTVVQTKKEKMPDTESTMQNTKSISKKSSTPQESAETQRSVSIVPSLNLNEETSASLNLLKSTSNELVSLMKGLNQPSENRNPMQLLDTDRVRTAAEVAKQIVSCMRTSLDIVKFVKENDANS